MKSLYVAALAVALAPSASAQVQPPIHFVLDLHPDPIPNSLAPAQKIAEYQSRLADLDWVLDQVEPYGVKISFLATGQFMEILASEGPNGAGAAALRRVYSMGGQIGSHSHSEHRLSALNWPNYTSAASLAQAIDSWQDNVDWVNQALMVAFNGTPPEPLASINCVKGAHLPQNEPDFHTLMASFGFAIRQPGPEEDYYAWYGHHIWNPFRPSSANYMGEDLSAPFVQITQGTTIGRAGIHHGIFQDMTTPAAKRQFLQLYVNWRYRDRHGLPPKVWTWGWGGHPEDYDAGGPERAGLAEMIPWLDLHFAGKVEPTGSDVMTWSTHRGAAAAYVAWEASNPGVSSFSFDSLSVNWDEYPYLRPVAEEMRDFGWVADLDLGSGVSAFHLRLGADDAVLAWRDTGASTVDLSALLDADARVIGLETGLCYGLNAGPISVAQEPLLVTELERCAEPVAYCDATPNSTGVAAAVELVGSTSVSAGDFALRASGCPPNASALFIYSPAMRQVAFYDGYLCVGPPVTRMGPLGATDAVGVLSRAFDLGSLPLPITAGSVWNFQTWFRDAAAGGAGANLSHALNAVFCP